MRTFLTRLTLSTAGVVLTGLGMAAAANAGESAPTLEGTPTYLEETVPVVPEVNRCDIEFTVQDCVLPVDENPKPVLTVDPELIDPGFWDDDDAPEPGDDTSDEPEDGGPEKPEDGEDEPVDQPADDGQSGGRSQPAGSGSGDTSTDASDDKASGGKAPEDVGAEPTPLPDETAVTPAAHVTAADEGGNRNPLVGVLAIALGTLGFALVGLGLGRRPQPARERWR